MVVTESPLSPLFSPPFAPHPLQVSRWLLTLLGVKVRVHHLHRIPPRSPVMVVSNHRSFLDAPLLMAAMGQSVRFACHHYMSQVPGLRELVTALGCMPLDAPDQGQSQFFRRATTALKLQEAIGIFPEGAAPMVRPTCPHHLNQFQRGFAHLAMRAPVETLTIVPFAIASNREANSSLVPLQLLSLFDPSEPLFQQAGWHPVVFYREVDLIVGRPVRIDPRLRSHYSGRGATRLVMELTDCCQEEVATLLKQGFY